MKIIRHGCLAVVAALLPIVTCAQQASKSDAAPVSVSMCTGCHGIPGYQSTFPRVYKVPKIAGQSAKYIEAALAAYKKGDRDHPTMRAIAQQLDEKQIAWLAGYYAERGAMSK